MLYPPETKPPLLSAVDMTQTWEGANLQHKHALSNISPPLYM
jgi:hypothetical protein